MSSLAEALPVLRVEVRLRQRDPLRLPPYAGSMLRGAFGHALRRSACVTRQPVCEGCPLLRSCAYPALFEAPSGGDPPRQVAHPYAVEPSAGAVEVAAGELWSFTHVLVGRAIRQLPLVVHAWRRAASAGFGARAAKADFDSAWQVFAGEATQLAGTAEGPVEVPGTLSPAPPPEGSALALEFITPLRLQENGRILGAREIDAPRLLTALARRVQNLLDGHGELPLRLPLPELHEAARCVQLADSALDRFRWARYSTRQQRRSDMTGLVGTVELQGELAPFRELLALGEFIHVGKGTTFGLGRYRLRCDASSPGAIGSAHAEE